MSKESARARDVISLGGSKPMILDASRRAAAALDIKGQRLVLQKRHRGLYRIERKKKALQRGSIGTRIVGFVAR